MKGPSDRTKVVLRRLPPTISQSGLVEHIDSRFGGRYRWLCFRPGKTGQKHPSYSRAYIDFNRPDDVIEFAEFFNGHVFVNEKGTQFKAIVEYAPSQRVPKQWSKKDVREGTLEKDPEYLEFLEIISKPVENLPSAEIQLERKEAERAGAPKEPPIVTPLMDYVRQRRAAKSGSRRMALNGKPTRRVTGVSSRSPGSGSSRRGSEKRRTTTMYVSRDSSKGIAGKDKPTYMLVPKRDDQQLSEKSSSLVALSGQEASGEEKGGLGSASDSGKKILLLKGKEKEITNVPVSSSPLQTAASAPRNPHSSTVLKQSQRRDASGRIIRSILLNKDSRQNPASSGPQSELQIHTSNQDRDRRPPRPPSSQFHRDKNEAAEDKFLVNDSHGAHNEKQERRTRNRDRPDRGVWTPLWTPLRHSEGSHASDESLPLSTSETSQSVDSTEGASGETKHDMPIRRSEYRAVGGSRGGHYSVDNGSYRHVNRRGSAHNVKDVDGASVAEGKPSKRGGSSGYGSHEKQVWVQKSSSGS